MPFRYMFNLARNLWATSLVYEKDVVNTIAAAFEKRVLRMGKTG